MSVRVAVISDTHLGSGRGLPLRLMNELIGCDLVVHAGDIACANALCELRAVRPTTAVYGNCDGWDIRSQLPRRATLVVEGVRFGIIHGDGDAGSTLARAMAAFEPGQVDVLVFGHTHQPLVRREPGLLVVNPGSALRPRFEPTPSYAVITVDGPSADVELIYM